jgi:hypothetical protein
MQRKATTRRKRAHKIAQLYREDIPNDFLTNMYHIEPCEALLLVYADEDREPQDGERVFMHYARFGMGCGCIGFGFYAREENGDFSVTHDSLGHPTSINDTGGTFSPDSYRYLMRLVGVVRHGKHEFFADRDRKKWSEATTMPLRKSDFVMSDEEYEAEFGHPPDNPTTTGSGREARVKYLKSRLGNLQDEGESWNESGVFRLKREIYDLERKLGADEWPEVIGDE